MDFNPFRSGATQEMVQEKKSLDPVNKAELKGKHKDRKDKDIDNDGDVDTSDKYLHKRRKAISKSMDDTKEGYYKDLEIKKQDKEMGAKPVPVKKKKEAKGGGKEGDVEMNPKMDSERKAEQKESKIRSALKSVLERKENHSPNQDKAEKMGDNIKGQGAKDMMAAADDAVNKGPEAHLNEPEINKKNFQNMTKNVPSKKMRKNDNPKGDSKIVPGGTQFKNPAAMKAESFGSQVSNMAAAYAAMQPIEIDELDESMLGHKGAGAVNGGKSLDPKFKSSASHIDYHHRRSDGHMKSGGDEDQHRYQVAKKLGYKV